MKRLLFAALAAVSLSLPAHAQLDELAIMAPAAPGGGWDQTARSMQQALTEAGLVANVQVTNVPGAGGTIGLAQFVNNSNAGNAEKPDRRRLRDGRRDHRQPVAGLARRRDAARAADRRI